MIPIEVGHGAGHWRLAALGLRVLACKETAAAEILEKLSARARLSMRNVAFVGSTTNSTTH